MTLLKLPFAKMGFTSAELYVVNAKLTFKKKISLRTSRATSRSSSRLHDGCCGGNGRTESSVFSQVDPNCRLPGAHAQ